MGGEGGNEKCNSYLGIPFSRGAYLSIAGNSVGKKGLLEYADIDQFDIGVL
jgi:hypothetical protein